MRAYSSKTIVIDFSGKSNALILFIPYNAMIIYIPARGIILRSNNANILDDLASTFAREQEDVKEALRTGKIRMSDIDREDYHNCIEKILSVPSGTDIQVVESDLNEFLKKYCLVDVIG